MGLFSMNRFSNVNDNAMPEKAGKWYKKINTISIVGIFVAVAIIVLAIFKVIFQLSPFLFGVVGTIAIVCASLILMLPWINKYERNFHKKVSLVFIIFIGVCAILWIICLYMAIGIYKSVVAETINEKSVISTINFVKVSLILSLQLLVSSVAATGMLKYKKTNYFLQGVCYASYLFFDFYITFALACVKFSTKENQIVDVSESIKILGSKIMIVILILAVIFIAISNVIMNRDDNRKMQDAIATVVDGQNTNRPVETVVNETEVVDTPEEKLAKLKKMFESELITKEEYENKKADILKDM